MDACSLGTRTPNGVSNHDAPRFLRACTLKVACGDKAGNILVYDMTNMELVNSQVSESCKVCQCAVCLARRTRAWEWDGRGQSMKKVDPCVTYVQR